MLVRYEARLASSIRQMRHMCFELVQVSIMTVAVSQRPLGELQPV